ncbi:SapC family protein [Paraferrimonas haliotis]|uniref:Peptidase n=1 Tax=Paraferrimonas haliotis TaxID=2013866 RepID=A0AA37TNS7_9GAMM|nr:SapC family protein [Paraferrimonas haliotis]GLS84862.1 peptidase [Paraferrimonas haliotis]
MSISLLDPIKHNNIKISDTDYSHVATQQIVAITAMEFDKAATEYPIVFIKNSETGAFQAVAMLGLKPQQNLSVQQGNWQGLYIPAVVRDYPLAVIHNPDEQNKLWIGIREDAPEVSETMGNPLFNGDSESDYLSTRKNELVANFEDNATTQAIVSHYANLDLFSNQSLTINVGQEKRTINGIYVIDQEKLNGLSDEQFLDLKNRGLLAPIYTHLTSLNQFHRLARLELNQS